jgi:flagellar hook-basal body complex protein FliE
VTLPFGGIVPVGIGGVAGGASTASISGTTGTTGTQAAQGSDGFAAVLAASFDQLQSTQKTADGLAAQAATGDLKDVHDYMIASTEASLATEMVVTIKNKAVEAFNEIMRMPV